MPSARESPTLTELLARDRRELGDLHVVLDGARDDAVHALTREFGDVWAHLDDGVVEPSYQACAPRLIALEHWPQAAIAQLLEQGWGRSWGVFLRTKHDFLELRRHLRTLWHAQLPSGEIVQFRFYDPRVLRAYLPICTTTELAQVFGPIEEIVLESEDPAIACRSTLARGELTVEMLSLASRATGR
jgi:hypothetical protein